MFLRRLGHQVHVLHSYRDGGGKVVHRRFGQWEGAEGVHLAIQDWERWQAGIKACYPELRVDWTRLRAQAEEMAVALGDCKARGRSVPEERLPGLLRGLLRHIAETENIDALSEILTQLTDAVDARLNGCDVRPKLRGGLQIPRGERSSDGQGGADLGTVLGVLEAADEGEDARVDAHDAGHQVDARVKAREADGPIDARVAAHDADDGEHVRVGTLNSTHGRATDPSNEPAGPSATHAAEPGATDEASEHPGGPTLGEDEEDGEWGFVVSSRLSEDEEEEWPDWGLTAADSDTLPELLSLVEQDLVAGDLLSAEERGRAALDQARRSLPGRRRRFEPHDPAGSHYLRALELLGDVRRRQELWPEWCRLARLRAEARPDAEALFVYGSSLQQLGRPDEALVQYARAPYRHPWRFYLSAAAACQLGRREDCIDFVLGGLVRDRQVWRDRQRARAGRPAYRSTGFWERFGLVWSKEAFELLAAVAEQPAVCGLVAFSAKEGVVPRKLFFAHGRKILSRRVQAVMEGKRFCIMTNELVDANTPLKKIGPGLCEAGPELAKGRPKR